MNEDRNLIVGDNQNISEPISDNIQQEVKFEEPDVNTKPEKKINAAVILVVIGIIAVVGYFASLLIIPVLFKSKVEPEVKTNIALSAACSSVDKNGNYSNETTSCKNYVCTVTIKGKEYTKDCSNKGDVTRNIDPEGELTDEELGDIFN